MDRLRQEEPAKGESAPENKAKARRGRKPRSPANRVETASRKTQRYPEESRKALLARYEGLRAAGQTAEESARRVGVPYITLRKWQTAGGATKARRGRPPGRKSRTSTRRLEAPRLAAAPGLVLVTPTGFRIEGLRAEDIIQVLQNSF